MDADIQISAQTDWFSCQVCDSVTLSFVTHGLRHLFPGFIEWSVIFPFALLPSTFFVGGVELVQAGTDADGRKFKFSRHGAKCASSRRLFCLVQ